LTVVIPGEFFRDSIPSLREDPFIPTQLRVSSFHTLTTLLPLDNLTYLDLSYNEWLIEFPLEVLKCTALRKLNISGCRSLIDGRLPGCLAELRSLEWLSADLCEIIAIGIVLKNKSSDI
jgi:Leucine-rich repeat (LRR) protein